MWKPHVFLSSRLRLGGTRKQIKDLLEEAGFSTEIYEADSTPSSEPATYLRDIVEADFVIFVLDQTYGAPRKASAISGVHEEWNRVREYHIPNHVYLKRSPGEKLERRQKQFIESELVAREISYYYYGTRAGLLQQIRRSVVKMALDIAKSRRQRSRLELSTIAATVAERDHETFCRWNRTLVALRDYEDSIAGRLTDGWGHLTDQCYGADFDPERVGPFVDTKAQELFAGALRYFGALSEHDSNQSLPPGSPGATLLFPSEEITVREYSLGRPYPHNFYKQRETLKTKTFKAWDKLGDLVRSRYTRYADLR